MWQRDSLGDFYYNEVTKEEVSIADVGGGGYDVDYDNGSGSHITIAKDIDDFDDANAIAIKYVKNTKSYKDKI